MAKRDVILRYAQVEHEYLEMQELLRELQADLKDGQIDSTWYEERAAVLEEEINNIKTQYFFWGEAIYELNKPNRQSKKLSTTEQSWYQALRTATKECLKDESQDALSTLKSIIKEGKTNDK